MPFVRKVLEELNCPRCNAWAQLRIEEERDNGVCIVYLVCDKCKLHKYVKIISRKAVNLMSYELKLRAKIDLLKPGLHKNRLIARLNVVHETIRLENRKIGA